MMGRVDDRIDKQYFISPTGRVVKYKGDDSEDFISLHYAIAEKVVGGDEKYPDDVLMERGWILVGSSVYHFPYCYIEPTQKQIDALFDLGLLGMLRIRVGNGFEKYKI